MVLPIALDDQRYAEGILGPCGETSGAPERTGLPAAVACAMRHRKPAGPLRDTPRTVSEGIVRAYFEATNRRDFASVMDAYAEDVVLLVVGLLPDGTFSGRTAVGKWFGDWFSSFGPDYRFDLIETREVGERVFATARHHGIGRASGVAVDAITAYAFTVRAGKIVRAELYADRADALKAVGLAE